MEQPQGSERHLNCLPKAGRSGRMHNGPHDSRWPPLPCGAAPRAGKTPARWYRAKDPALLALKRSVRAAVVMPSVFALAHFAFSNGQVGLFASFGSFALLLLVEFRGRPGIRLGGYLAVFATGCVFIVVGTLASSHELAAIVAMAVVGFGVLYLGIVVPWRRRQRRPPSSPSCSRSPSPSPPLRSGHVFSAGSLPEPSAFQPAF